MKKRRSKGYNKFRTVNTINKSALDDLAVAYVSNGDSERRSVVLIDLKGNEVSFKRSMLGTISVFQYRWCVHLIVGCHDSRGHQEIKIDDVQFTSLCSQKDLPDYLNDRHQEFISNLRRMNVDISFVGWVARAKGRELKEVELFNIFKNLEAWP